MLKLITRIILLFTCLLFRLYACPRCPAEQRPPKLTSKRPISGLLTPGRSRNQPSNSPDRGKDTSESPESSVSPSTQGGPPPPSLNVPPQMYDPKCKPKGLIDGLTKFFTPTNRRKSRSSSQSSAMGFYPIKQTLKPKSVAPKLESEAPIIESEAPIIECKPDDEESKASSVTTSPTPTKEVPPQLTLNTKNQKTPSQAAEDNKSHSNSSSPHSQLRTGSSQLKGLFDGLSHLYAAPTEPRKRGLYGIPPVYVPPKRMRKSSLPSTTTGPPEAAGAASKEEPSTPEGKITPTKIKSLMKTRSGLSASASKIVKKAKALGNKKKGISMAQKFASVKKGTAAAKTEVSPTTQNTKAETMSVKEEEKKSNEPVATTSSALPPGKPACAWSSYL